MSNYLNIKKIEITGVKSTTVSIEFGSKLTIIIGGSDSGKTYFYNLIRYLFGSDNLENADIGEAKGYDTAYIEFLLGGEHLTIERDLHDNSSYKLYSGGIDTVGLDTFIKNIVKTVKSNNSFNSIFYDKLSFNKARVRINGSGGVNNLNLGNILDFFFIDEIRILTPKSLLLSDQYSEHTKNKSEFKFLISQRDDATIGEEKPNKKAKVFLKKQVNELIDEIKKYIIHPELSLTHLNEKIDGIEIEIEQLMKANDDLLDIYDEKISLINEIRNEIINLQKKESYLSMLINRFSILKDCYISDLQRVNSISQANFFLENFSDELCEKCGYSMKNTSEISYEDYHFSCMAESKKINSQLLGLIKSIESNEKELGSVALSISDSERILHEELDDYSQLHDVDLKESRRKIEELYEYKETILSDLTKHKIIESLVSKEESIDEDKYESTDFDSLKVHEINGLIEEFKHCLNSINFNGCNDNNVCFDDGEYDFIINGKPRALYGKGSRAVIYACFTISLAEFLAKEKKPQAGLVLLDSPLVTHFDKKRDIQNKDVNPISLTDAFYKHLINSKLNVQVILIENKGPSFSVSNNEFIKIIDLNANDSTGIFPVHSLS